MRIEDEIKGRFRNEYHKGLINLRYTVNYLSYNFMQELKKHDITESQYNVLRILRGFQNEAPLTVGFIKERMMDKSSDVSRIVDKLFNKKLVNRIENTKDRRQKLVSITEKGLDLLNKMCDCEIKADLLLKNLSLEEVQDLNFILDKIRGSY